MSDDNNRTLSTYLKAVSVTLNSLPLGRVEEALRILDAARANRRRIYIFGNGGSAATASHFACDLSKGAIRAGNPRMRVHALVDNTPVFSAWANDTKYESVFSEQLTDVVEPGDVAVAISGSGNSPNVLEGVKAAQKGGAKVIGFCGFDGGRLAELADIPIVVDNNCMEQVEDIHLMLAHAMAVCLKQKRSSILAVTRDADELVRVAQGYLEGGRYGKAAAPSLVGTARIGSSNQKTRISA